AQVRIPNIKPDALPAEPGAYLLMLALESATTLPPRFDGLVLTDGFYVYTGSAYGPGGIRARCRRHISRPKARHWHVDWLTSAANDISVAAFPGKTECALVRSLSGLPGAQFPVPGFGSSDCRRCQAHLLRFPDPKIVKTFCERPRLDRHH
ncbi:MAG: GIY-YIG nuclease family protein, partial [Pseudomonadota bacterium]